MKTEVQAEKKYIINISNGNDNEPSKVFVGANGQDYLIERGRDVAVPKAVLDVLDQAVVGIPQKDPNNPDRIVISDRKRFPYTIVGVEQ